MGFKKKRAATERPHFFNEHSFSQIQQDRWVLEELREKRDGFFVEIGAFDGKTHSNTYLLETAYGWKGILAEPNPILSDGIRSIRSSPLDTRPVDSDTGKSVVMRYVADEPELSAMADRAYSDQHAEARRKGSVEIAQSTISLDDLLQTYNAPDEIDFISIDTEGNEPDILSSFDFDRYTVRLFCVEHNYTDANVKLDQIMFRRGYERVYREWSRFDAWYRKI
ncbi:MULTISPECIES: FkbM family methyltransferase [unclassified Neorhizobium]|uniref:FkbM family methyltransferase n=1 Tax=unclassified Neorhizobium TaxID=2629175 RepID=UPI001FF52FFD|nr:MULTISPECIES: FkbM family methyltransferase [unclassified Neorhizobium]MCJ9673385.1 FkbM family methyltransferase [Neorhizobium sp. SHOUNA12B]MCJ9748694.1 FkbM family methyltransferase [Neorhizobium sp. SHOUNA12A]